MNSLDNLIEKKKQKNLSISLVIPALNEESTIGAIIQSVLSLKKSDLIDEIVVFDGGSSDQVVQTCNDLSVKVATHKDVLNHVSQYHGKGFANVEITICNVSDIIVWIDSDIREFDNRFVVGLIGPMILNEHVKFAKAFYQRPYIASSRDESNVSKMLKTLMEGE